MPDPVAEKGGDVTRLEFLERIHCAPGEEALQGVKVLQTAA
jgi:hypothetical protein